MAYQTPPTGGNWRGPTLVYQDYFEMAFATADSASMWWQPWLKGVGRTHLELAGMQSRNARAWMQWGRTVSSAQSPADWLTANLKLWDTIGDHIGDAIPKVSDALSQAAQAPPSFELVTMPNARSRDAIVIPEAADAEQEQRRVA